MKLFVLNQEIEISDAKVAYNSFRLKFQREADAAKKEFFEKYKKSVNAQNFVFKVPEIIEEILQEKTDLCLKEFVSHDIYTIDREQFWRVNQDIEEKWFIPYSDICEKYEEISLDENEKDIYRKARRKARGRWVGGGFGISGAVKGAAEAGILNATAGAGHMLVNGAGKIVSSISANSKRNKIFNNPRTYSSVADGLWDTVFSMHIACRDCIVKENKGTELLVGSTTKNDEESARSIVNNLPFIKDEDQHREMSIKAFLLNPYQENWYLYMLGKYGDPDGSLSNLGEYFGIGVIKNRKAEILEEYAKGLSIETESEAIESEKLLRIYQNRIGYHEETETSLKIHNAVREFDIKYRTVEEIVFSTRKEADRAKNELSSIKRIIDSIDYSNLDSIKSAEDEISEYTTQIANSYREKLHQEWGKLEKSMRTVDLLLSSENIIVCNTIEDAKVLREHSVDLLEQYRSCGDGIGAEEKLKELFESVENQNDIPPILKGRYIKEIKNRLNDIDKMQKTVLGKEYETRERAEKAQKEYDSIKLDFKKQNAKKCADQLRERINSGEFSDAIKDELLGDLFRIENEKELKTVKMFSAITAVLMVGIVIVSYFFSLSGTPEFATKNVVIKNVSLMITDVQVVENLKFLDGLKNGVVVFGRCIGDIFVNGFYDYIFGFSYGLIGNIIWAIAGIFVVCLKEVVLFFPRYFVSLFVTLLQKATVPYYIGYVIGSAIPFAISKFGFDQEDEKGSVERVKGWTPIKILGSVAITVILLVVIFFFIRIGY